jgi:biotin synthase-related radical SAM superfamily protein
MDRSYEIGYRRVFVVGLAGVVGFGGLELGHVLGADQGRLVAETASRVQEFAFIAAGCLGADREAV